MTPLDLLRERGPMRAVDIANVMGLQIETVYTLLVRAYDAGQVRVNMVYEGERETREWEAMDEAIS